ncbi:DNA methyltransferase [Pseudomonas alliivorans]|nr:DNA methyltransferase [Pseudomonas alliivorans]
MITTRIWRQLENIDWDFSEHLLGSSKAIHWYPGTFPSELPGTLIQALSVRDDLIFDPYGGIGTTALESLRQGRRAWLVEGNPVGCIISYVSAGLLLLKSVDPSLPAILVASLRSIIESNKSDNLTVQLRIKEDNFGKDIDKALAQLAQPTPKQLYKAFSCEPNWESLAKWVEPQTFNNLRKLHYSIVSTPLGDFGKLAGLVMISAILRPASSQTQSWGHIADNVLPKSYKPKDIYKLCNNWLSRTQNIIVKTQVASSPNDETRFWLSLHSWQKRKLPKIKPNIDVNVLLTSPPYAGAIDYTLAQRLSLYLLGHSEDDVKALCSMEIGARRKRFLPASQANWVSDMVHALSQQVAYLSSNASLAFVLPHKDAGREAGPAGIEGYLGTLECSKLMEIERSIRQGRARQSWTSIKKEIIQIYGF